jgi:hypothetical protein
LKRIYRIAELALSRGQRLGIEGHAVCDTGLEPRGKTQLSLADIGQQLNPLLRGWLAYYGRYAPSALAPLLRYVNQTLMAWAMRKFKRFKGHKIRAGRFLQQLAVDRPGLFMHWQLGMRGVFN